MFGNQVFAIVFVVLATAATFLMYYLWGFPFNKEKLQSEAPRPLLILHRVLGYLYVAIYLYMMWQMVPRMWTYQVELPARTVVHLLLGMGIGATLFVKVAIVRLFKHMESVLVPFLGTMIFIGTLLLIGLALPTALRERFLQRQAQEQRGNVFTEERLERVRAYLPLAGLDDPERVAFLATDEGLLEGRAALRVKCVQCHDLRTILARPRTPENWRQTIRRMAQRSTVLNPVTEDEEWAVAAYLIAITPTLQETVEQLREQQQQAGEAASAARNAAESALEIEYDPVAAEQTFESTCSQCHSPTRVEGSPPGSVEEAQALVRRMVSNGLSASEADLGQIVRYLIETFVPSEAGGGA